MSNEAIDALKAVLCDPEGEVSIIGSDKDREIIKRSLEKIEKLFALDKKKKNNLYDVCCKIYHALEANAAPLNLKYALTQISKEPIVSIETPLWQMFVVAFEETTSMLESQIIHTWIPYHLDTGCSGCTDIIHDRKEYNAIFICNECGEKRRFILDDDGSLPVGFLSALIPDEEHDMDG